MNHPPGRAAPLLLSLVLAAACSHDGPYDIGPSPTVGPYSQAIPRQLTFYYLADRTPSVHGDQLVFSRQNDGEPDLAYTPYGREQCIAFMPAEGGTIQHQLCPNHLLPPTDTLVDTWIEPALSPDGKRIAFTWQRGYRISALALVDAYLMVTPVNTPQDTTYIRHQVMWSQPDTPNARLAQIATHITWVDSTRVRYLATFEHIIKVKGGGAERVTDTIYKPLALLELNLQTGVAALVPGGDSTIAYTTAPDGALWLVKSSDSSALLHVDPTTGQVTPAGRFSMSVWDLANVGGKAAAVVGPYHDGHGLWYGVGEWIDSAGTTHRFPAMPGPWHRLAAWRGNQLVAEIENSVKLFGAPPDLWLLEIP